MLDFVKSDPIFNENFLSYDSYITVLDTGPDWRVFPVLTYKFHGSSFSVCDITKSSLPDHDFMNPRTLSARFQAISAALGVCTDGNEEIHRCIMGDDLQMRRMPIRMCRMALLLSLMRRVTNS